MFEQSFKKALQAKSKRTMRENQILAILEGPNTARKRRILRRMENHARGAMGIDPQTQEVDWESFDWASILKIILEVLLKLLPLILV